MNESSHENYSLIQSLEKRGLLDITKAYLRSNIYESLKSSNSTQISANKNNTSKAFSNNSSIKLSISLIIDFMRKLNLSYSLSVFNNESKDLMNTYPYTESELLSILNIKVANLNSNPGELFNCFLCYLAKEKLTPLNCTNSECQTDYRMTETGESSQIPIDELLRNVDMKYTSKINMDQLLPSKSFEERMSKFKTELDSRYQIDLDAAIKRFKDIESAQIRIEENKKYLKKIDEIRDGYEKEYKTKFDSLAQRENEFKIRMTQKDTDYETLLHHNRQKFQEELELIRIKEGEMNRRVDNEMNKLHLEENKLQFQFKENDHIKDTLNNKINEQIGKFKFEYDKQFEEDKKDLEKRIMECTKKELIQSTFQEKYDNCLRDKNELNETVNKIRTELKLMTSGFERTSKDNEALREQIRTMALHEKRNIDTITKNDIEIHLLKDEIQLFKQSYDSQKNMNDNRRNDLYDEMNRKMKEMNEIALNKTAMIKDNDSNEIKVKSLEDTCNKYKDMCNTLIKQQKNQSLGSSGKSQVMLDMNFTSKSSGIKVNNMIGYSDRRRILAQLEDEQILLNKEIKSSFKTLTKKETPLMILTEEQIKQIQKDNYLKTIVNNEKERYINDIYKRTELSEKEKKDIIKQHTSSSAGFNQIKQDKLKENSEQKFTPGNSYSELPKSKRSQEHKSKEEVKTISPAKTQIVSEETYLDAFSRQYDMKVIKKQSNINTNANENTEDKTKYVSTVDTKIKEEVSNKNQDRIIITNPRLSQRDSKPDIEISVENISSDSKDWNLPSEKNKDVSEKKESKQPFVTNPNKLTEKNSAINTSIKEEIEDSSPNISNLLGDNNNKDSSSMNKSAINKFQNLDYENKKQETSGIEEYGEDFIDDVEGLDKNKQSLDLEALKQASIGHLSNKRGPTSINKSNTSSALIDKMLQSHHSNIEENIEEEFSYDNNNNNSGSKKRSNHTGNDDSSSNKYNDFINSNMNLSSKKDITIGKDHTSGEIKEEIIADNSDEDGYDPY